MANNVLRTQGSGADLMLHPGPKTIYKQPQPTERFRLERRKS